MHYALSSTFSLEPNLDPRDPTNLKAIIGHEGEDISYDENPIYTWYCIDTRDSSSILDHSSDKITSPDSNSPQFDFKLGMDLVYCNGKGNNVVVIYEVSSASGLLHTIRLEDGTKLDVHDSNLQLIDQPYFSNIPRTNLNY